MKRALARILLVALLVPLLPVQADETEVVTETAPAEALDTASSTPVEIAEVAPAASMETVEVIVKLDDASSANLQTIENLPGVTITNILADDTVIIETTNSAAFAADIIDDLPSVSYAEPSYERTPFVIPTDDTFKSRLWALENTGQLVNGVTGTSGDDIDALPAWNISLGTSSVVAVIDSGVLYTHPDLAANMWDGSGCVSNTGSALGSCLYGYDFADNDLNPYPVSASSSPTHGTHVSGTIAAVKNNATGTIGVAPSSKIMALRFDFNTASEVRAIDFARLNGAKIINASFGGPTYSQSEYDAIKRFTDAGGIFVASAGNAGDNSDTDPIYPAAYDLPGIISVAATDQNDALASFSSYGTTTIDIGAPGVNIASTYFTSTSSPSFSYSDGTSMAAPHVAGVVALIESVYTSLSAADVKAAILSGGDSVVSLAGKTVSGKRLNAFGALAAASSTDITAPVITLTGDASITLTVGDAYSELGATAFDARDGTTTVTVGGDSVNTSSAGTYHVTYDAVDIAGNHAIQVVRTVTIQARASSGGGGGGGGGGGSKSSSNKKTVKKVTTTKSVARPALSTTAAPSVTTATPKVAGTSTTAVQPPATPFVRQLAVGSTGPDVTALQNILVRTGAYTGPVTGYFGPLTAAGVRTYQIKHGLAPVGFVGPMTRIALNSGT